MRTVLHIDYNGEIQFAGKAKRRFLGKVAAGRDDWRGGDLCGMLWLKMKQGSMFRAGHTSSQFWRHRSFLCHERSVQTTATAKHQLHVVKQASFAVKVSLLLLLLPPPAQKLD
jgi:hypothetical protein